MWCFVCNILSTAIVEKSSCQLTFWRNIHHKIQLQQKWKRNYTHITLNRCYFSHNSLHLKGSSKMSLCSLAHFCGQIWARNAGSRIWNWMMITFNTLQNKTIVCNVFTVTAFFFMKMLVVFHKCFCYGNICEGIVCSRIWVCMTKTGDL